MAERKAISFYHPPGMDPTNIPKEKRKRGTVEKKSKIRLAMPFSALCLDCHALVGTGKRLLVKKDIAHGEAYLGKITVYRFSARCPECGAPFVFKTDPKNADFAVVSGIERVAKRGAAKPMREIVEDEDDDAGVDAMEALEARAEASRREMEDLEELDDLRQLRAAQAGISVDDVLASLDNPLQPQDPSGGDPEKAAELARKAAAAEALRQAEIARDEAEIAALFGGRKDHVKRLQEDHHHLMDEGSLIDDLLSAPDPILHSSSSATTTTTTTTAPTNVSPPANKVGAPHAVVVKVVGSVGSVGSISSVGSVGSKRPPSPQSTPTSPQRKKAKPLSSLLLGYGDDDSSDDESSDSVE